MLVERCLNGIECWHTVAGPFFCNNAQYKRSFIMSVWKFFLHVLYVLASLQCHVEGKTIPETDDEDEGELKSVSVSGGCPWIVASAVSFLSPSAFIVFPANVHNI